MLKKHQELLEMIQAAESKARALFASGCQVDDLVAGLRGMGAKVKERIVAYKRSAKPEPEEAEPKKGKAAS